MKNLFLILVLALIARWFYLKVEHTPGQYTSTVDVSPRTGSSLSKENAQSKDRLFTAAEKFAATAYSLKENNENKGPDGQPIQYQDFETFFASKTGGREALALLESSDSEKISDSSFKLISDSLSQIPLQEDPETRIKILNRLAGDADHAPAVRTLALRELFTKLPQGADQGRDPQEHERTLAAYETYLATKPNTEEILRVTVDNFYFNEDTALNEEIKTALSKNFPDLVPKIENRYKDPSTNPPAFNESELPATENNP